MFYSAEHKKTYLLSSIETLVTEEREHWNYFSNNHLNVVGQQTAMKTWSCQHNANSMFDMEECTVLVASKTVLIRVS